MSTGRAQLKSYEKLVPINLPWVQLRLLDRLQIRAVRLDVSGLLVQLLVDEVGQGLAGLAVAAGEEVVELVCVEL